MKIVTFGSDDLVWPLGTQETVPYYLVGTGEYLRQAKVDPYPGYTHDFGLVSEVAEVCERAFPLRDARLGIFLLGHEFIERTNGFTYEDSFYPSGDADRKDRRQALTIALCSKRTPIMPAMTRYLVTHEYGHAAFYYAVKTLGIGKTEKLDYDHCAAERQYMELRGVKDYAKNYSGGKWHASPGEIIANDFRILCTGMETEFWPHDVPRPQKNDPVHVWWERVIQECAAVPVPEKV